MTTGPVSQALQTELLAEVRRQGIVVWLDKDASYTGFVDHLAEQHKAGGFPYPVVGFRGSFLETLFALEAYGSGYDKHSLVVHMPGFNEDSIRTTPILELYSAGTRFRKALETLIRQASTGRALPDDVEAFLSTKPTLEAADKWLAQAGSQRSVGLEVLLESSDPTLVVESLVRKDSVLSARVAGDEEAGVLRTYLQKLTGIDDGWWKMLPGDALMTSLEKVMAAFGSWVLCVEYVHDLRRAPHQPFLQRLRTLSPALVKVSLGLVAQLRRNHADAYVQIAQDTEAMLGDELDHMTPDDLGHTDTFPEEENLVLEGAINALKTRDWTKASHWCKAREGDKSFWLQREQGQARRRAWNLVGEAAAFGRILSNHPRPFEKIGNYEDAITRYAESGALVDRAHRRFEQEWLRCRDDTQLPYYGAFQEVVGTVRQVHRTWADRLAVDFTQLCKAEGFLPPPSLQQRTLYEQVVQPMAFGGEKVAVFLVDAFRYEMATELVDDLRATGGGAVVDLKARYAELPTITSVGMNALAPIAKEGRLTPAGMLNGFRTGEYTVKGPADRARAMGTRTSGKPGRLLTLANVCDSTAEELKRKVKDHQIVVVCSSDIDDAGEANVGLLTFEAQLSQIKAAWHHLQSTGIKHAVFTADHGFLLQDSTTQVRPFGKKTDPQRRHIFDDHERGEAGLVPVQLSKLGYDGMTGYVLFREDTAVFATGTVGASFVHGGNSPQERIIPVLTVTRKRAETSTLAEYAVETELMSDAFGFHRIRVRLVFPKATQTSLGFVAARSIDLDLRVPERRDIRALVKEVSGAGTIKAGRVNAPVGDTWTEVFFALEGPVDERAPIEVYHADNIEKVVPSVPDALFTVAGVAGGKQVGSVPQPTSAWADAIEDESIRAVFIHIEKHGAVTETEIIAMLGSARAARRFSLNFDGYLAKLPFKVRSESNASGKRYTREEN